MIEIEEFRDIPGYEGLYEVSNLGRVRSLETERILKPSKNTCGYLFVSLYKNGIKKAVRIHRLVALAFIPNPDNLPCINHKDEDKTNNTVDNLEWCDDKYNANYGTRNERIAEKTRKPVLQYDLLGNFIREWPSITKVEEETGIWQTHISKCCLGLRHTAGGYLWKYKN